MSGDVSHLPGPDLEWPVVIAATTYYLVTYPGRSEEDALALAGGDADWHYVVAPSNAVGHGMDVVSILDTPWAARADGPKIGPRLPDGNFHTRRQVEHTPTTDAP